MVKSTVFSRKTVLFVFFLMSNYSIYADPLLDGPEPPPNTAPIDDWIIPMLVFAIILGAFYFQKRTVSQHDKSAS